jgi:hypothetical protein
MNATTILLFGILILAYLYMFVLGRDGVEGFSSLPKPINTGELRKPCKETVIMEQNLDAPYLKKAILDVDDYEYNLIFQNEGDREITKALQNKLQSQYPMDWSVQPPSSIHFQAGKKRLEESFANAPALGQSKGENPYKEISGDNLTPPDTSLQEMEERKILQTYRPKEAGDLTTYNLEDAQELIKKIYDAKGLIPEVKQKGGNIFEIVGTRRKDEKIVYEDEESPAETGPVQAAGEATITVPPVAADVSIGLDPFFTPSAATKLGRWDYTKFTPGLERMFAPTYPTVEWY